MVLFEISFGRWLDSPEFLLFKIVVDQDKEPGCKTCVNKSHAAAYAVLSYVTAYLKYHYPADYMCAVLSCTDNIEKVRSVLSDCREIGVKVLPPDINNSDLNYSVVDDAILFGLNSIKGTKIAYIKRIIDDRTRNGEYTSFKDFLKRADVDKSTAEGFIESGALDCFCDNRMALKHAYEKGNELVKKLNDKKKSCKEAAEKCAAAEADPEAVKVRKRYANSYAKAQEAVTMLEKQFEILRIEDCPENKKEKMSREKESLGFYISCHPLDDYKNPIELNCIAINDLEATKNSVDVMGLIQNLKITKRKSDGKAMAFFDLEDKTGLIHVCCFTDAYEQYGDILADDLVVRVTGNVSEDVDDMSGEVNLQIFMKKVQILKPDLPMIELVIRSIPDWNETLKAIEEKKYLRAEGHPLVLFDALNGEYRKTKLYVSKDILNDEEFQTKF